MEGQSTKKRQELWKLSRTNVRGCESFRAQTPGVVKAFVNKCSGLVCSFYLSTLFASLQASESSMRLPQLLYSLAVHLECFMDYGFLSNSCWLESRWELWRAACTFSLWFSSTRRFMSTSISVHFPFDNHIWIDVVFLFSRTLFDSAFGEWLRIRGDPETRVHVHAAWIDFSRVCFQDIDCVRIDCHPRPQNQVRKSVDYCK